MEINQDISKEIHQLKIRGLVFDKESNKIVGFNSNHFAKCIQEEYNLRYAKDGYFYQYDESGIWVKQDNEELLSDLRNIFQQPRFGVWTPAYEKQYMITLQRTLYHPEEMNSYKNLINLKNGMFNIDSFELLPHNPKYFSTIQIPIEYQPEAKCQRFNQFCHEVFEGDIQRIVLGQEWAGYALTTETKAQKALVMFGGGENGKGVFIDIISLLIGPENISNVPLNELSKGFSRVCLHNKTVNISSENETDGKSLNTQYFKAIVGEDTITAEQKGKPVFSFKPTAKLLLAMNNLSYTRDKSHGYFRRFSILNFSDYFGKDKRDNNLKETLRGELPGIFLWAIDGLKRLKQNNYKFSQCENMNSILEQYKSELNPMIQFFDECIVEEKDPNYREDNKVAYNTYKNWVSKNGLRSESSISSQRFWREFESCAKSMGYKCESGKSNSLRYHSGIRVVGEYKVGNSNSIGIFERKL